MKFSVVIPLYNGSKTIEQTLDSVLAQTCKDFEIVLVNDESPDNVGEVVKKYIKEHPETEFVYIEQKNKGLGGARNTAIKQSTGEIIAILDQDDIWYPEKLKRVLKAYNDNPEAGIVCHNLNVRKNNKIVGKFVSGPSVKEMHRKLLFGGNVLYTPATTFRRSVTNNVGLFSEDKEKYHLVEDYELWLRIAHAGYKYLFVAEILGEHVIHENNYSKTMAVCMYKSELNVLEDNYYIRKKKKLFDWYRIRRSKAELSFRTAYRMFGVNNFWQGWGYVFLALFNDPIYICRILKRVSLKELNNY
jgi:glycosyltransferase involved in cell wall biosynthesis